MEEQDARAACEQQGRRNTDRAEDHGRCRGNGHEGLGESAYSSPTQTIDSDQVDSYDDWPQAIERAAHDGGDAQGCIAHRERKQDEEPWKDKAQAAKQTTPPTPAGVTQKHAELGSARARQHIDEREAFDEPFFGDPLPLFLELGLHDTHDGGTTVSRGSQLEQVGGDLLPVSCEIRILHGRHLFLPTDASRTTADALRLHWAPLVCPTSIRTRAAMTSRARP